MQCLGRFLAIVFVLITLGACHNPPPAVQMNSDLTTEAERIAATLTRQMETKNYVGERIVVATMVSVDDLRRTSPFGRVMAEHVSSALAEDGSRVVETRLMKSYRMNESGSYVLSRQARDTAREVDARGVVAGSYAIAQDHVFVDVRVIDRGSSTVIASARKRIERGPDVDRLLGVPASQRGSLVPGFEKRFNESMCCAGPADVLGY